MEKYYNDYNTVLKVPTTADPYTESVSPVARGYECPKTDLFNVYHEMPRKAINIYFEYATPEYNYACHLEEGSPIIWDLSFVKEGKLIKASGVVDKIEFHSNNKLTSDGKIYSYSLNGVLPPVDEAVIRFDCSMEQRSKLISVTVSKIRKLQYSKANIKTEADGSIILPKNSFAYMERFMPSAYRTLLESFVETINGSEVLVGDYCFQDMVNVRRFSNKLSFPKMITADYMFNNMKSLSKIEIDDMPELLSAEGMFDGDLSLESVVLNAPKAKNLNYTFKDCHSLTSVEINAPQMETAVGLFKKCDKLREVRFPINSISCDLEILSPVLSPKSIVNIIMALRTSDRSEMENMVNKRKLIFAEKTKCPPEAFSAAILAMVKGGWDIDGLYSEGGELEKTDLEYNTPSEPTGCPDEDNYEDYVKVYKENSVLERGR